MTDNLIERDTVEYNDPTPFDNSKLQSISEISKALRHKMHGKDVREPIAQQGEALVKLIQETGGNQTAEVQAARGNHAILQLREDAQDNAINKAQATADSKYGKSDGESYLKSITAVPETCTNLTTLKAKYPTGKNGLFVTADTGHKFIWSNNNWEDAGIYQSVGLADGSITAEKLKGGNKLYSILPMNISDWDSLKINTRIGDKYSYNSVPSTVENNDGHYYTSADSYGLYSRLIRVKRAADVTLIGSVTRYVSLIEYDANLIIINASEWKSSRTVMTLNSATSYIVIAIKNKDNSVMTLNNVTDLGVDVLSETFKNESYEIPKANFEENEWQQGYYNMLQSRNISNLILSNYRISKLIRVNPSTEYSVRFNKNFGNKKYRMSLALIDSNGTVINNSGWIITKNVIALRTSTSTTGLCLMFAGRDAADINDVVIRPNESELIRLEVGDRSLYDKSEMLLIKDWQQGNVGIVKGQSITTGASTNRIFNRIKLHKNTTYLINMNAPIQYRFDFVQATDENIGLYDTFWRWGEYRLQTGTTDEFLYVVASLKTDVSLNVESCLDFNPIITEISPLNSKLDVSTARKIIMHRGASLIAPENTVSAIIEAARAGMWATEMDVQYTSDGVAVIMHDATIDRTTTGTGKVSELTLEQIKTATIDFGVNIDKYANLKVPTLDEAITACKRYGIIPVLDCGAILQDDVGVRQLLADLKRLGIVQRCIILSQGTADACNFRYYNQSTPMIVQYTGSIDGELEARRLYGYRESYCGGWNFNQTGATDAQLTALWSECHKLQLQAYAITDDKAEAERFINNGCDFISSDDVKILDY